MIFFFTLKRLIELSIGKKEKSIGFKSIFFGGLVMALMGAANGLKGLVVAFKGEKAPMGVEVMDDKVKQTIDRNA